MKYRKLYKNKMFDKNEHLHLTKFPQIQSGCTVY